MRRLLPATLVLLLLVAGACDGGDDRAAGANAYSEALADNVRARGEVVPFTDDELGCLSREAVAAIGGPDAFDAAGAAPDDVRDAADLGDLGLELTEAQARELGGAFEACDVSVSASLERLGTLGDATIACVEANLDEEAFAELAAAFVFRSDPEVPPGLADVVACFGDVTLPGATGDDPTTTTSP